MCLGSSVKQSNMRKKQISGLLIQHNVYGLKTRRRVHVSGLFRQVQKGRWALATFTLIIGDEPASWESRDGRLMFDAIRQAIGKRAGQRLLLIGTLAPSEVGSWWPSLISAGSNKATGVFVTCISADVEEDWLDWETVKACNPMMRLNKTLRNTQSKWNGKRRRQNPYFKPSFEAFRLNRLVETREEMLCRVPEWQVVEGRPVPPREGKPIVGLDLGAHRSWSAMWALWPNGRSECFAVCVSSIPVACGNEKKPIVYQSGLYVKLKEEGTLADR